MGRRAKPTALKELAGNPGKRELPKDEPKPKSGFTAPPAHLSSDAKRVWKVLGDELVRIGIAAVTDVMAFEVLCEAYATYVKAKRELRTLKGTTYTTKTGSIRKRPQIGIMTEAARLIRQYGIEFGLSPSARTRVAAALGTPNQPALPGAEQWKPQEDPSKKAPTLPDPEQFTHGDYFGGNGGDDTRH